MKKLFFTAMILCISLQSHAFLLDIFKKPATTYTVNDINVITSCDDQLSQNENYYVVGQLKNDSKIQMFFNINGRLTLDKSIVLREQSENSIVMDGGFLKYNFGLIKDADDNKKMTIINADGVIAKEEVCR